MCWSKGAYKERTSHALTPKNQIHNHDQPQGLRLAHPRHHRWRGERLCQATPGPGRCPSVRLLHGLLLLLHPEAHQCKGRSHHGRAPRPHRVLRGGQDQRLIFAVHERVGGGGVRRTLRRGGTEGRRHLRARPQEKGCAEVQADCRPLRVPRRAGLRGAGRDRAAERLSPGDRPHPRPRHHALRPRHPVNDRREGAQERGARWALHFGRDPRAHGLECLRAARAAVKQMKLFRACGVAGPPVFTSD